MNLIHRQNIEHKIFHCEFSTDDHLLVTGSLNGEVQVKYFGFVLTWETQKVLEKGFENVFSRFILNKIYHYIQPHLFIVK